MDSSDDIIQELRRETQKLFQTDTNTKKKAKFDPEKSYLKYIKSTNHRSQQTIYDSDEPLEDNRDYAEINMSRILDAANEDYINRYYDIIEKTGDIESGFMKSLLSTIYQRELSVIYTEDISLDANVESYIKYKIPSYIILGDTKIKNYGLIKTIYKYYTENSELDDTTLYRLVYKAIKKHLRLRIGLPSGDSIIAKY